MNVACESDHTVIRPPNDPSHCCAIWSRVRRYDLFDQFWGKERDFYRKEVGDFLARNVAAELLNYSKNYLLQAVRKIPEFAHLREKNICLIDDRRT